MMISSGAAEIWPYTERNETGLSETVQAVLGEPEIRLNEDEKQAAELFARGLYNGRIDEDLAAESDKTLSQIYRLNPEAHQINLYHGYIEQAAPELELPDWMDTGVTAGRGTASVARQLCARVAREQEIDGHFISDLASKSAASYRTRLRERLLQDSSNDAAQPDVAIEHVQLMPALLLEKCADLQAYRRFYRQAWNRLKSEDETPLLIAKKTHITLHLARVNGLLAAQYPALAQLGEQLDVSPDTAATNRWRAQLYDIAPSVAAAWRRNGDRTRFHADFARRNDYIRNGVSLDAEGRISPVSADLDAFAAGIERGEYVDETGPSQVSPEIVERLEHTVWEADQLKTFLQHILAEWELLSTEECDWHEAAERSGPAADNKWQVFLTPKVNSLDANGRQKVMWIPEEFSRTLLQQVPSGVLLVSPHELAHVLQAEADEELAASLPLAGIKGRRSVTMKEMGAVFQEAKAQSYFGNSRSTNTTYLRALQAKLAGRNNTEVARAFIEARRLTHPDDNEQAAVKSGKAAMRLNRHDGFDSQPLDYLVQGYLIRRLRSRMSEDALAAFSIAATGFSLRDTASLRAADLFEIPKSLRFRPAETVIRCYFESFDRP